MAPYLMCDAPHDLRYFALFLCSYLSFFHAFPVEVFNAGEYRRRLFNGHKDAEWFNPDNAEATDMRRSCNEAAVADMEVFLKANENGVVILDSVNSTFERRHAVLNRMHACGAKVLFIEVQNTSEDELRDNIRDVAKNCPDYEGMPHEQAVSVPPTDRAILTSTLLLLRRPPANTGVLSCCVCLVACVCRATCVICVAVLCADD